MCRSVREPSCSVCAQQACFSIRGRRTFDATRQPIRQRQRSFRAASTCYSYALMPASNRATISVLPCFEPQAIAPESSYQTNVPHVDFDLSSLLQASTLLGCHVLLHLICPYPSVSILPMPLQLPSVLDRDLVSTDVASDGETKAYRAECSTAVHRVGINIRC